MPKKSVRFNPVETVYTTYSSEEYDRSRFSIIPISFTFRPNIVHKPTPLNTQNINRPTIKPLDLSLIPNSSRRASSSLIEPPNNTKKPKLSINTSSLTPLFFSKLSTHCKDEDEDDYGYLIPVF